MKKLLFISKNLRTAILLCAFFVFNVTLNAQETAVATISATIATANTIEKIADFGFGDLISANSAGTVVLDTDGSRTFTNVLASATPGDVNPAQFEVVGTPADLYTLTFPTTVMLVNEAGYTIEANTFTTDVVIGSQTMGTLPANGKQRFYIGATLHLTANQPSGVYTNTTDLTVTINF